MITTDIIKAISDTAHDRLIASRHKSHKIQVDSEATHPIVSTAHAHQVVFALEINVHVVVMNIPTLIYIYATCYI